MVTAERICILGLLAALSLSVTMGFQLVSGIYRHDLSALRLPVPTVELTGPVAEFEKGVREHTEMLLDLTGQYRSRSIRNCVEALVFGSLCAIAFALTLLKLRRSRLSDRTGVGKRL